MKVALYARVSRDDLELENQLRLLVSRAEKEGWLYEVFKETMSSRKTRPVKEGMLKRLREGEFDALMFTRLDRFARSSMELVLDIDALVNQGVRVIIIQQGLDFDKLNAMSRLQLQILGAFAEFEREIIRERTLEGLARAKAQGKKLGRQLGSKNKKNRPPLETHVVSTSKLEQKI